MLPTLLYQIITLCADGVIFILVGYYLLKLHKKEQELEKREGKLDADYHQAVDSALTKERKILEDASQEANHIITDAQYVSNSSKELVNKALQEMMATVQKEAMEIAKTSLVNYQQSLQQLTTQSLNDFQAVSKNLQSDLQKQVQQFHQSVLPAMEKELEEYKKSRMDQTERMISHVIQTASAEIMNKSISLDDHQSLILDSLEKAKNEGILA